MSNELSAQEIRDEIGEILDSLNALPVGAFAERAALVDRQHTLRKTLQEIDIPGSKEIMIEWSARAGSKPPEDKGQPVIVSPTESGGLGSGGI